MRSFTVKWYLIGPAVKRFLLLYKNCFKQAKLSENIDLNCIVYMDN